MQGFIDRIVTHFSIQSSEVFEQPKRTKESKMVFFSTLFLLPFLVGFVFTYPDPSGRSLGGLYDSNGWQWSGTPGYRVLTYDDNGPQTTDSNFVNPPANYPSIYIDEYPPEIDDWGYSRTLYPANEHKGDLVGGLIGGLISGLIIGKTSGEDYVGFKLNGHHIGAFSAAIGPVRAYINSNRRG